MGSITMKIKIDNLTVEERLEKIEKDIVDLKTSILIILEVLNNQEKLNKILQDLMDTTIL
jgi:PII-like signaling protein